MLKHRIITALALAAALLILLFYASAQTLVYGIFVVAAVAVWEWSKLANLQTVLTRVAYTMIVLMLLWLLLSTFNLLPVWYIAPPVLFSELALFNFTGIVWAFIFLWVISYPASIALWYSRSACLVLGVLVLVPFFFVLIRIYFTEQGADLILYLLLLVAAADVGAYFFGKQFGQHKLHERVSPGKTWEGFFGGLFLAMLFSISVFILGWNFSLSMPAFFTASLIAVVVSALGDLFESILKRQRGIKDSSNIFPGHGGMLDRIDSHLAAIPVFYLLYLLLGA